MAFKELMAAPSMMSVGQRVEVITFGKVGKVQSAVIDSPTLVGCALQRQVYLSDPAKFPNFISSKRSVYLSSLPR